MNEGIMDQVSAHLDRGWELMSKGDFLGASISAAKVLELDPDSPEGYVLRGALAWAGGDPDEAMESFEEAMGLDPDYPEPILYAAEVAAQNPERVEEALRLCNQALETINPVEEKSFYLDVGLLKAELLNIMSQDEACELTLNDLLAVDPDSAMHTGRIGRLYYDLLKYEQARQWLTVSLSIQETADTHYYLGAMAERDGDFHKAISHNLKVRELDLKEPSPRWILSADLFRSSCMEALHRLPESLLPHVKKERLVFTDSPSVEVLAEGADPRVQVGFCGVSSLEADTGNPARLDYVFVYKLNIERSCHAPEDVTERFVEVLARDLSLFLGIDSEHQSDGKDIHPSRQGRPGFAHVK